MKKTGVNMIVCEDSEEFHWKQNSCLHFALKHLIGINASNAFPELTRCLFVRVKLICTNNTEWYTKYNVLTRFKRFLDVNMHFRLISPSTLYVMQSMSESYWTQAPLIISTASIWVSLQMILHWKLLLSESGGIYS